MMKIYYVILAVFLSGNSYTQIKVEQTEQTQTAHQYIVQQAYQYLYSKLGRSIPTVENHLGNWETGSNYFNPGNKIVIGAYREDEEDIVYNNGWPNETSTHFWNPDDGDGSHFCNSIQQCFPNAYTKAQKYLFGGWQFNYLLHVWGLPNNNGVPCATQLANLHLSYNSLVDMFLNKRILINKVEFFGQGTVTYNPPRVLQDDNLVYYEVEELVNMFTWEILGRVCHLLADVSTPAHALNDQHDITSGEDYYENMMGGSYSNFTYQHAITQAQQWGMINITSINDPIKYLFFTSAQIAGHFPSRDVNGNNSAEINDAFYLYPPLQNIINLLGAPPPRPARYDVVAWMNLSPRVVDI